MPRPRLSLNSVRIRLALWNVGVLALVLVVIGIVFSVSIRANVNAAVDSRLSQRAHRIQRHGVPQFLLAPLESGQDTRTIPPQDRRSPPSNTQKPRTGDLAPRSGGDPPFFGTERPARPGDDDVFGELRTRFFSKNGQSFPFGDKPWDWASFRRSLRGEEVFSNVPDGNDVVRVLSVPIQQNGKVIAVLQCGNSLTRLRAEQARTTRILVTLIPLVLLIAGLGGAFLTERALRPVRRIAHEAGSIEVDNLSRRLPVTGNDEFADLAETFNNMLARLEGAFARQEQAFEQQKRFTADASHELRTPLTIIKANTSLALSGPRTAPELQKTLQTVDMAADRMTRIVQDLLLLARSDAGQLTYAIGPTPLADVLSHALLGLQSSECAPVTVLLAPPTLQVMGHADALIRLFGNLLENAVRYTPTEGRITVSAELLGDNVLVVVSDTGEGIASEHLSHVTERFYRVEAARSRPKGGTGLGLAICRSIVEAHHGTLGIESVLGEGTAVRVTLPSVPEIPSLSAANTLALSMY